MNILLPWSLASYIPLNGFHPLYRSLASIEPKGLRLIVPGPLSREQYRQLIEAGVYRRGAMPAAPAWAAPATSRFGFRDYAAGHQPAELIYASHLSADVELHHTAPVTTGERPFVLHFESFLPVFMPHLNQGTGTQPVRLDAVRAFYSAMFESDQCLAIASHITTSLEQFSDFFRSSRIDRKLVHFRNGIDPCFRATSVRRDSAVTEFLFINSAHQNPLSFALRGGISCLELALDLLRDGLPVRFLFRTGRPSDSDLTSFGIDPNLVRRHENDGILWIDNYLSDAALSRLMAKCHFLLLPSANLHSISILSAMVNGTIPVVSDTYGNDSYVTDGVDAVVVPGVRAAIWSHDAERRIVTDNHASYRKLQDALGRTLIVRIRELLANPERIAALSAAARRRAETSFDGSAFAAALVELVRSRMQSSCGTAVAQRVSASALSWGEEWAADLTAGHFAGPPQPVQLVDVGSAKIFRLQNKYITVPDYRLPIAGGLGEWSELHFATERHEAREDYNKMIAPTFEAAVEAALEARNRRLMQSDAAAPYVRSAQRMLQPTLKEFAYYRLEKRPRTLKAARAAYRALRRVGVMK